MRSRRSSGTMSAEAGAAGTGATSQEGTPLIIAGVDRSKGSSTGPKVVFALLHAAGVAAAAALLLVDDGLSKVGGWFDEEWSVRSPRRAALLVASLCIFWSRHAFTLRVLLQRRVMWAEALPLGLMILVQYPGYALLAAGTTYPANDIDGASVAATVNDWLGFSLVLVGSWLTGWSELQRHLWKKKPENKGHCYTGGLVRRCSAASSPCCARLTRLEDSSGATPCTSTTWVSLCHGLAPPC